MGKPAFAAIFVLVAAVAAASGCTLAGAPNSVGEQAKAEALSYSTPIVQAMLQGMNSGDYAAFSAGLSPDGMQKLGKGAFDSIVSGTRATIGKYISLEGSGDVMDVDGFYKVTYSAQFTQEDHVSVTISFKKGDATHLVDSFHITSKKISGQV